MISFKLAIICPVELNTQLRCPSSPRITRNFSAGWVQSLMLWTHPQHNGEGPEYPNRGYLPKTQAPCVLRVLHNAALLSMPIRKILTRHLVSRHALRTVPRTRGDLKQLGARTSSILQTLATELIQIRVCVVLLFVLCSWLLLTLLRFIS